MAFYSGEEDEQDPNNPQQQGPSAGGSFIQGQGSAPGSSQVAGQAASAKPDNPGNFVGIQQYIDQNKGQAKKLAGQVGNYVKGQGQEAQTALQGAQQQFGNQVQGATVNQNQELLDQAKTNATTLAQSQEQADQFKKMRDAQYQGPMSLDQNADLFQPVMQAINKAKTSGQQVGTVAGRDALLRGVQNQANNRASAGAASLDNAILGTSADTKKILGRAKSATEGLDQSLSAAQQQALGQVDAAKATTQQTAQAARDALTQGYQGLGADLTNREATRDQQELDKFNAFKQAASMGQLSPEELGRLGLTPTDVQKGVDLSQFLNYKDTTDKYSVANQDDLARQSALKQLAGDYNLGDDILSSSAPLGQAGESIGVDKSGYEAAGSALAQTQNAGLQKQLSQPSTNFKLPEAPNLPNFNSKDAAKLSLGDLIKKYQDIVAGTSSSTKGSVLTSKKDVVKKASAYLNNVLLPAQANLQNKYGTGQKPGAPMSDRGSRAI